MSSQDHLSELELFGLDMESRKMKVLEAVLKSVEGESATSDFAMIYETINNDREEKLSKAWIYSCLGELEEDQFVVVDRISTPNRYMATKETIAKALETAKKKQMIDLQRKLDENMRKQTSIQNASIPDLARELAGRSKTISSPYSQLIEGSKSVRSALISEICSPAGDDSIIRVSNSSGTLTGELDERGPVETKMLETVLRGVEFRVLFFRGERTTNESESISLFMKDALPLLRKAVSSGRLKFRVIEDGTSMYPSVMRDQEKMILYLSDTYKADAAFLISKHDNEMLIKDTIRAFDKNWRKSTDMTTMMKAALSRAKQQSPN